MKKIFLFCAVFCLALSAAYAGGISTSYRNALVLAYSQANSVYEDDNIKLEIYNEKLWATNKTQKTIFIDLSQCFAVHNGSSTPLLDNSEKKQGDNKASKKGFSTNNDAYMTIAPSIGNKQNETFICNMSVSLYGKYTTSETPSGDFTDYDKRLLGVIESLLEESKSADPKGKEYIGTAVRHLTEDESINNIGASIAYAFNKKAENWTNVSLSTWVSDVIFAPYFIEMPKDLTRKEKKGFGVKETAPSVIHIKADTPFEFDEDKSPIIVCDWTGKYNKGMFTLAPTWVSKTKTNVDALVGSLFTFGVSLAKAFEEVYYKKVIDFDGKDSDWGKMTYSVMMKEAKQKK